MAPEEDRSDPRHRARKHPRARADWTHSGAHDERGSRRRRRVPVLVYHHVYHDDAPELQQSARESGAGVLAESQFLRQMQYVKDAGWQVVSTTQMVEWLTADAALPDRALVLHFDNGWLDTLTVSLPILHRLGMVATCFPITDGVEAASQGEAATVRTLTEGVVENPFMTWDQVGQLYDSGWEIGAHTATHCKLVDRHAASGDEGVLWEVQASNARFQERLGFLPNHFAYPSGSRNERTDALLAKYYRSLRLWHFEWPIQWTFTDGNTSPLAIDCQNIDLRVPFAAFQSVLREALAT